jgi:cytochrome c peroxidase
VPTCDSAEKNEGRSEALDNLAKYITSLKFDATATNTANTQDTELSKQRGARLFRSSEFSCSACHAAPLYTDNENHIVNLAEGGTATINTPSLLELARSSPYYHDGRFKTLHELLDRHPADIEGQSQVNLRVTQ